MSFRVTPKFRRLLEAAAEKENRSLRNMLETLLLEFCCIHGIEELNQEAEPERSGPVAKLANEAFRPKAKRRS